MVAVLAWPTHPEGRRAMTPKKKTTTKASPEQCKKIRKQRVGDAGASTIPTTPAVETAALSPALPSASTTQAAEPTKSSETVSNPAGTVVVKLSALDAAVKVLRETGQAMSCPELIAAMAAQGYWSSPTGRTPASTLYAAILRELQTKGVQARFVKTERGKFALRGAM